MFLYTKIRECGQIIVSFPEMPKFGSSQDFVHAEFEELKTGTFK